MASSRKREITSFFLPRKNKDGNDSLIKASCQEDRKNSNSDAQFMTEYLHIILMIV